jgi:hypothetical protein
MSLRVKSTALDFIGSPTSSVGLCPAVQFGVKLSDRTTFEAATIVGSILVCGESAVVLHAAAKSIDSPRRLIIKRSL